MLQTYYEDRKRINKDIKTLQKQLIEVLQTQSIELIDLYYFINKLDILKTRKSKIEYLIALEYNKQ